MPGRLVGWLIVDPKEAHMANPDTVPQPTGGAVQRVSGPAHDHDDRHGMATSGGWVVAGCSPFLYVFAGIGARLCAGRLDAALASGVEPTSDRLLARRAAQLTNPRTRERFADALDACVAHARRPKPRSSLAVPISRDVLFIQGRLAPPRTGPARHWRGLRTRHGACPATADRRRESHIHRRPVQHARARGRRCRRMSGR